ncbi:hypothetical protein [Methylobacterium soli]|uniref:Uncharacterized protein n=1 Tax=Methylobacterium soli TaxID=553447 RepID=A0A6L3SXV6_9HYPH|nr:hypothetical protein [Methylobacterium soli]KAB1073846.1 hypothetical protein F6X53_26630 [Methylobacterium soli]GJE46835.1 hypothetical protein AEGHOMDF_6044 [Methylobacterium soli]
MSDRQPASFPSSPTKLYEDVKSNLLTKKEMAELIGEDAADLWYRHQTLKLKLLRLACESTGDSPESTERNTLLKEVAEYIELAELYENLPI